MGIILKRVLGKTKNVEVAYWFAPCVFQISFTEKLHGKCIIVTQFRQVSLSFELT